MTLAELGIEVQVWNDKIGAKNRSGTSGSDFSEQKTRPGRKTSIFRSKKSYRDEFFDEIGQKPPISIRFTVFDGNSET